MSLKLGNTGINGLSLGSTTINKAYLGAVEVFSSIIPNGLLNNLVSYYKCDVNGSFPSEVNSPANDGTINGATFTVSGKINGGYDYDGINDDVSASLSINTANNYSIGLWCDIDLLSTTGQTISINNANLSSPYSLNGVQVLPSGKIRFFGFNVITFVNLETNNTYSGLISIMITFTGSNTYNIYVNGVLDKSGTITTNKFTTSTVLIGIGRGANTTMVSEPFEGMIDEIGIWDTDLTQTQITTWNNSDAGLSFDNFTT